MGEIGRYTLGMSAMIRAKGSLRRRGTNPAIPFHVTRNSVATPGPGGGQKGVGGVAQRPGWISRYDPGRWDVAPTAGDAGRLSPWQQPRCTHRAR